MPLDTKPEDIPAPVHFRASVKDASLEIACAVLPGREKLPYRIDGGSPGFKDIESFKAKAVHAGLTPAVAEDFGRSFNATARQLRELGFIVEVEADQEEKKETAA
ncbi:MAG TPA: hypothetical protein VHZ25_19360 [Acidobacteriaceae bacterium]|jgi:hypothetical protein|nr:hypothetical protein [Acidobacteriaceae bacterium]